mmetsp:Transcript_40270/g.66104  ORF Transcript_40270/g.66104 Transcript_40270/m.66104 type:complete len:222 (+) Transcript_40270:39-704(+)
MTTLKLLIAVFCVFADAQLTVEECPKDETGAYAPITSRRKGIVRKTYQMARCDYSDKKILTFSCFIVDAGQIQPCPSYYHRKAIDDYHASHEMVVRGTPNRSGQTQCDYTKNCDKLVYLGGKKPNDPYQHIPEKHKYTREDMGKRAKSAYKSARGYGIAADYYDYDEYDDFGKYDAADYDVNEMDEVNQAYIGYKQAIRELEESKLINAYHKYKAAKQNSN